MSQDGTAVDETTEEKTDTSSEEVNILELSEEDFDKLDVNALIESSEEEAGSDDSGDTADSDSTTQDTTEEDANSDSDTSDDSEDDDSDDQSADDVDEDTDGSESSEDSDDTVDEDESTDEDDNSEKSQAEKDITKILAPFKANGKDIQVDNVDDAIILMKMGANYNKKMAALKPNLKIVKMLENNDLLDEGKLNFLIDISKKNPNAIKQLIKDSGIDPLEIDVKEDTGYESETYNVGDNEVELDLTLSDLKDSPKFKETMDIISNKMDAASREVLVKSPDIIRVINEHVELGIYDKIMTVVDRERMLGKLPNLNDLQAYKQVSDAINANGGMKTDQPSTSSEKTDKPKADTTEQKQKTKARKKSAATTTSTPGKKSKEPIDILAMSDAEIEAMPTSKYM